MKLKKLIKRFGLLVVILVLLYTLLNGVHNFYLGYHNLDLAYNFINLGYTQDLSTAGEFVKLHEVYLTGRNQIKNGFMWITFDVILGVLMGFLIRGDKK